MSNFWGAVQNSSAFCVVEEVDDVGKCFLAI